MSIDTEIDVINSIIDDYEATIRDLKECPYFAYKIECLEEDLHELNTRLEELEAMQDKEWSQELRLAEKEYWQTQF